MQQALQKSETQRRNSMEYNEFLEYVQNHIKEYLPEKYQDANVTIKNINKNNGCNLDGLTIVRSNNSIVPTIYLNDIYQPGLNIQNVNNIVGKIAAEYVEYDKGMDIDINDITDIRKNRENLVIKVVNHGRNLEFLQDVPYKQYGNLAAFCQVMLGNNSKGTMTMNVTNENLKYNQIEFEEVFENALENMPKMLPYQIHTMASIIQDMMSEEMLNVEQEEKNLEPDMYVMTNSVKMNGAATILYPGALENIGNKLHSDFYVLPSSIHEVIIIPKNDYMHYEELEEMVSDVNNNGLKAEEILGYKVYEYDRCTHELYLSDKHTVVVPAELEMRNYEAEKVVEKNSFEKLATKFWNNEKTANYNVENEIDM